MGAAARAIEGDRLAEAVTAGHGRRPMPSRLAAVPTTGPAATPGPRVKPAISVVGLGYVGAVSTGCLSSLGHRVVGVDLDPGKVSAIATGRSPIHEAELGELLATGVAEGLVTATTEVAHAIATTEVTFLSVGTPTAADGSCDTRAIREAARAIGEGLRLKSTRHTIVMRCSVPPGTTMGIMVPEIERAAGLTAGEGFGVAFNPEFLREGCAVADFREPPKTVIGATDDQTAALVASIFAPLDADPIHTPVEVAEMVKYVDNTWHALKVCFGNEVGRVSKALGLDGHAVMDVFCRDTKLNLSPNYLKPGMAYGGSCLPKDVRALTHVAREHGQSVPLMASLAVSNAVQVEAALDMVRATGATRVGVLGVAFKRGTDDLRGSPVLEIVRALIDDGIEVRAHDPVIAGSTDIAGQIASVEHAGVSLGDLGERLPGMMHAQADAVADWADALLVTQALPAFRSLALRHPATPVIDACRLFDGTPDFLSVEGIGW